MAVLVSRRWPWLVVGGLWLHAIAIAWLAPIGGDDWAAFVGRSDGSSLVTMPVTRDLIHWSLCNVPAVHVVMTPLVAIALLFGLAALALQRLPDPRRGDDAIAVLVISSLLWIADVRTGLVYAHRATAAAELYGSCAAVWFAIVYARAGGWIAGPARRPPAALAALAMLIAGVIVGATTRYLGTVVLLGLGWHLARTRPRAAWAWTGLAGVAIGIAMIWASDRSRVLDLIWDRGWWAYLHAVVVGLRAPTVIAAGVVLAVVIQLARGAIAGRPAATTSSTISLVAWTVPIAIAIGAIVELSPRNDSSQQLFAAAAAVAVVACRVLIDLFDDRALRRLVIGGAVVIELVVARASFRANNAARLDAAARIAALEAGAPGSVVTVPPYRKIRTSAYVLGEDFRSAELRDRVATRRFGLRAIAIEPVVHNEQPVSPIEFRAVWAGPAAAGAVLPSWYSADLETAREQLAGVVGRARSLGLTDVRLEATGLTVPGADVIEAAWLESGDAVEREWIEPHGPPFGTDALGRARLVVDGQPDAVWAIELPNRAAIRLAGDGRYFYLAAGHQSNTAIVACTGRRCALGAIVFSD